MNDGLIARAKPCPWWSGVELAFQQGENWVGTVVMSKLDEGLELPTVKISKTAAQVLMDDLWNSGIRPTEGAGSAGSLRATEKHLEDMRKIAFFKLGVDKK